MRLRSLILSALLLILPVSLMPQVTQGVSTPPENTQEPSQDDSKAYVNLSISATMGPLGYVAATTTSLKTSTTNPVADSGGYIFPSINFVSRRLPLIPT